ATKGGYPVSFNDFFLFPTSKQEVEFEEFVIPSSEGRPDRVYKRTRVSRDVGGQAWVYRDDSGTPIPTAPRVLVGKQKEDGKIVRFEVVTDESGMIDRGKDPSNPKPVRWKDDEGRVMSGEEFGRIVSSGTGGFFFQVFAIILSWGVWFLCFWLLLLLQWPHALGISI